MFWGCVRAQNCLRWDGRLRKGLGPCIKTCDKKIRGPECVEWL